MSDQLRELLRDLAQDAPAVDTTSGSAGEVWRRARRSKRRDVIAAVSLSVVLLLVGGLVIGLIGPSLQSTPPTAPAYGGGRLAVPNQIWVPSPWTPGTAVAGPIGPLALIATAPRHTSWFHTQQDALFGVSARTGQYRFLDLPNADTDPPPGEGRFAVLSPDGREIGYWLLGRVDSSGAQSQDVGYAVYDTVTGKVTTHHVRTRFGLSPNWLTWSADSSRLVAQFAQWENGQSKNGPGTSHGAFTQSWDPSNSQASSLGSLFLYGLPSVDRNGLHLFDGDGLGRVLLTINPQTGARGTTEFDHKGSLGALISPDGVSIIFSGPVGGDTAESSGLVGPTTMTGVFLARTAHKYATWTAQRVHVASPSTGLIGWIDHRHVLVEVFASTPARYMAMPRIASLDVDTGRLATRIRIVGPLSGPGLATDLIDRSFVSGRQPQSPRDPRLIPGIVIGALIALVLLSAAVGVFRRLGRVPPPINSSSGSFR